MDTEQQLETALDRVIASAHETRELLRARNWNDLFIKLVDVHNNVGQVVMFGTAVAIANQLRVVTKN